MEALILPHGMIDYDEFSINRAKKLFHRMKQALSDIAHVSHYITKYDNKCIRTLKISELPCSSSRLKYSPSPFIRIGGRWVEKAGFQIGQSVQVVTIKDMILIVPVCLPFDS
jgi:toxic protein SymE